MSEQADNETLHYGFGESRLGRILVAVSDQGVVAILLGQDRGRLQGELTQAFPNAQLIEAPTKLQGTLADAVALANDPRANFRIPLDLRGSDLELAVWAALRAIPPGEIRSYGQLAKMLPVQATAQEVGAACAANVMAVAVPCHRVLKANGSISGYRWGVQLKRRLLQLEAA